MGEGKETDRGKEETLGKEKESRSSGGKRRRRSWKRLLGTVCLVGLVLIGGGIIALTYIEINSPQLRDLAATKISESLGTPVSIESLSINLRRGLVIKNIALGKEEQPFCSARKILLRSNFLSILRRRFHIRQLVIERPVIRLAQNPDGSWTFPGKEANAAEKKTTVPSPEKKTGEAETAEKGGAAPSELEFQLAQAEIKDGEVALDLKDPAEELVIKKMNLRMRSEGRGKPHDFEVEGELSTAIAFAAKGRIKDDMKALEKATAQVSLTWEQLTTLLKKLGMEKIPPIKGKGTTRIDLDFAGEMDDIKASAKASLDQEEITYGDIFRKPKGTPASLTADCRLQGKKLEVAKVDLEVQPPGPGKGKISLQAKGSYDIEKKSLNVEANTGPLEIAKLRTLLPLLEKVPLEGTASLKDIKFSWEEGELPQAEAKLNAPQIRFNRFGAENVTSDLTYDGKIAKVQNLKGKIEKGTLKGVASYDPQKAGYEFSLGVTKLPFLKFFSSEKEDKVKLKMSGDATGSVEIKNPGDRVETLGGKGKIEVSKGQIETQPYVQEILSWIHMKELMPLKYESITADFTIEKGIVQIAGSALRGPHLDIEVSKGTLDLPRKKQELEAELILSQKITKRVLGKFKELDRYFLVDKEGHAHSFVVYRERLGDPKPNLEKTLLKVGKQRLKWERDRIEEKIKREMEKEIEKKLPDLFEDLEDIFGGD